MLFSCLFRYHFIVKGYRLGTSSVHHFNGFFLLYMRNMLDCKQINTIRSFRESEEVVISTRIAEIEDYKFTYKCKFQNMASESQELFLHTILHLLFTLCIVYPPVEFQRAGFTIQTLFSGYLGVERDDFVGYHLRRSVLTRFIHFCSPLCKSLVLFQIPFSEMVVCICIHSYARNITPLKNDV